MDDDLITVIEKRVSDFDTDMSEWVSEAWDTYDFKAGRQYTAEEAQALEDQLKPAIVFNYLDKFLSVVAGTEISNEMNVHYYPSTVSRSGPVEVIQQVVSELMDDSFAIEHSEAFIDALTCGYGWVASSVEDSDGYYCIKEERVDPFEMGWDVNARRNNLQDGSWLFRRVYMNLEDVQVRWKDKAEELKYSGDGNTKFSPTVDSGDYRGYGVRDYKGQVALIHYQWRKLVPYVRFKAGGQTQEIQESRYSRFVSQVIEPMGNVAEKISTYLKYEYWQTYYCRGVLLEKETQINGFHYNCITGKRDTVKSYFYGLLRYGIDPQRWTNKFLSTLIHIMSTSGKGLYAEKGAVHNKDQAEFENNFSRPDKVKWFADGALSGNKVQLPQATPLPAGLPQLLEFSAAAIQNTLGINLEMLGMSARTQSGVVESSRKKAGLTVLARFFQSRRNQVKALGRIRLDFVKNYIPKEITMSLVDPVNADYADFQSKLYETEYTVKVDEAPSSVDAKQDIWGIVVELIPYLMNQKLPPMFMVELLRYSPLPTHIVEKLEKVLSQPQPGADLGLKQAEADIKETKSKTILNLAKAQSEGNSEETQGEQINRQMDMAKGQQDMAHKEKEHQLKMTEMVGKMITNRVMSEDKINAARAKSTGDK